MKSKKYLEPDISIVLLLNNDILAFSNDESNYNDSGNYFEDTYL